MRRWTSLALASLVAACSSHDGIWGPPGGTYDARAVVAGAADQSGILISVNDRAYPLQTATTGASGGYSFSCGDDDLCRITAHADSTVERDIEIDFRGGSGAPDSITFNGLGAITGVVTVGGRATGNGGIVVTLEGAAGTAVTNDAGAFTMSAVPAGSYTLAATLPGHAAVTADGLVVTYKGTTTAPPLTIP